jgi:DNA modification methylase
VSKYYENADAVVYHGNCLDELKNLEDNSIDAVVTDPPYELGFMGKKWDNTGIAYNVDVWRECLRVLKPGGHLLAFGGTRTWHRLAVAIEDAGFEVRDSIAWIYGSGFPKSHNISKAIDKLQGGQVKVGKAFKVAGEYGDRNLPNPKGDKDDMRHVADTDDAKKWDGWGTALKPAHEPIVVARKPLIGTVAENVLTYETGGLNIDASRIGTETISVHNAPKGSFAGGEPDRGSDTESYREHVGRWPANIILDETTAELLDKQSGDRKGMATQKSSALKIYGGNSLNESKTTFPEIRQGFNDSGGASRFFYVAKANKKDRNEGLDALPDHDWSGDGAAIPERANRPFIPSKNHHPTVKPTSLMTYLIKLVTPPNGIVLDPFTGSGSTGKAAIRNGFRFVGIELTEEYLPIITTRLDHEIKQKTEDLFSE